MITKLALNTVAMLAMSIVTGAPANSRDLDLMAPIPANYPNTSVFLSGTGRLRPIRRRGI